MSYINGNLKINIYIKNKNKLLANANISVYTTDYGFVTIKGFQIWKSEILNERLEDKINIKPPSIQAFGHYVQIVFFEDKTLWPDLEMKIYQAFTESNKPTNQRNENINPEDIPF